MSSAFMQKVRAVMVLLRFVVFSEKKAIRLVQRIMKAAGIHSISIKKYRPTPSTHQVKERNHRLVQDFSTTTINEKWVADITYIPTQRDGWCYLASVLDLHTKKVGGHHFSKSMNVELVLQALSNAIEVQQPGKGLILHTDLGTQYTSVAFSQAMTRQILNIHLVGRDATMITPVSSRFMQF